MWAGVASRSSGAQPSVAALGDNGRILSVGDDHSRIRQRQSDDIGRAQWGIGCFGGNGVAQRRQREGQQALVTAHQQSLRALCVMPLRQVLDAAQVRPHGHELLVDRDSAAVFSHIVSTQNRTGRTISYQRAEFFVFQNGKIIAYRSILDSFDIAEQVLGHEIDITPTVRILKAPDVARA